MGIKVSPALVAELVSAAPGRVVRKLDKDPEMAQAWTWSEGGDLTVVTDKSETVVVDGPVARSLEQVRCSCLLSPKCLHLLAVVRLLELDDGLDEAAQEVEDEAVPVAALTEAQRAAAQAIWSAAAQVLRHGLRSTGAVLQADLLRAVHTCRGEGLHRGAAAGLRLVQHARELRQRSAGFDLDAATDDLREALFVGRSLARSAPPTHDLLGIGRRSYTPVDVRRLTGLCTSPVVARTGYGGVVTWFVADDGLLWTLPHVMPAGTPGLTSGPAGAYAASGDLGELTTPHKLLCRSALILSGATGSADRRLGRGQSVQAALARGGERPTMRPGQELDAFDVVVMGASASALLVARKSDGLMVRLVAATDAPGVHYRHNLSLLAQHPGLEAGVIIQRTGAREPTGVPIALRTEALTLPSEWDGLVNLGLDELQPSYFGTRQPTLAEATLASGLDPILEARRRVSRVVLGGTRTLQAEARDSVEWDARRLEQRMMTAGAAQLRRLASSATGGGQSLSGRRRSADPDEVAAAWLAAAVWCAAADASLRASAWGESAAQ